MSMVQLPTKNSWTCPRVSLQMCTAVTHIAVGHLVALLARIDGVNNIFSNQCGISGLTGVLDELYGAIFCLFWLVYWQFFFKVSIYFSCLGECGNVVLLRSSRNVEWTRKRIADNDQIVLFWVNLSFNAIVKPHSTLWWQRLGVPSHTSVQSL